MEPVTITALLSAAAGYVLEGAAQSTTLKNAGEEVLRAFWNWIRPFFIEDVPDIEINPENDTTEHKTQEKLLELVQDEAFFNELVQQVDALRSAGITEKNIVKKDILRVKKIRIGDKEYSPDDRYSRKNIVEGNVQDADEFVLGDGH
jgi:hypothetical protein